MADPHHITPEHYRGFGTIVNTVAEIDTLLDVMIIAMIGSRDHMVSPLLTLLGHKDKRDYILAIAKVSNLPPYAIDGLTKLMKRVRTATDLRNKVAHNRWIAGRKPGRIKPLALSARETLKIVGQDHNEKEWSAQELIAEAEKNQELGRNLTAFMKRYGLYPSIERKTSGSKS